MLIPLFAAGLAAGLAASVPLVYAILPACNPSVLKGTAGPNDSFWMENIKHQGAYPYNPDPTSYPVFRNVKDYGAQGDGVTDDTAAINAAITAGGRCGDNTCASATNSPAVVYFPQGDYLVSAPLNAYIFTQLIGDARKPPTLLATANFSGLAVIDADPTTDGTKWYINQDSFYRSVRNFVIDLRQMPAVATANAIHWEVSQATSLLNILIELSTEPGNTHQGLYMEDGSGGMMGDIVINGGQNGFAVGNQQFTVRNVTVNNAQTAFNLFWNWDWRWQTITINNCTTGFSLPTPGGIAIVDAVVKDTPVFINLPEGNSTLVLNNVELDNVQAAVSISGNTVLEGGTTTITSWAQGNVYSGNEANSTGTWVQGEVSKPAKPSILLDSEGRVFGKAHPQYEDFSVDQIVSVKSNGAKGDGVTDDTKALQEVLDKYAGCKVIFFDAGVYYITSTLTIPAGTRLVGEGWTVIMGGGKAFSNQSYPTVMVRVGEPLSVGTIEITDIIFSTRGPAPGAIVVEWNIHADQQGGAGMWDTHFRLGGADGTNLQSSNCVAGTLSDECFAAFLALHLTPTSNAYFEGTWIWLADHDLDGAGDQLTLFSGRGVLSESLGPVWMIGTGSEHHTLYEYSLVNAQNHWLGVMQTETPYYQPVPIAPAPFTSNGFYSDPKFPSSQTSAWAVHIQNSYDITVFGAGLYSFFNNYTTTCESPPACQSQVFNVDKYSTVTIYDLATVGVQYQFSVDEQGVIPEGPNYNGFQSTIAVWTRSPMD